MDWPARAAHYPQRATLCEYGARAFPPSRCTTVRDGRPDFSNPYDHDPSVDRRIGTGHARPLHQPEVDETLGRCRIEAEAELEARAAAYRNTWVAPPRPGLLDRPYTEHPGMIPSAEPVTLWGVGPQIAYIDTYDEDPAECTTWWNLRATRTARPREAFAQREAFYQPAEPAYLELAQRPTIAPRRAIRGEPGRDSVEVSYYEVDA